MSLNKYEKINYLDKQGNTSLIIVKNKIDNQTYLLKKINYKLLSQNEKQRAIKEVKILSSLNHPNIIEMKEVFLDKPSNTLNLIMEYPNNGNLSNKIEYAKQKGMNLEESIIWDVLTQILLVINYLHKKGIIHRNLNSKNIFLSKSRLIKVINFNCCYIIDKNSNKFNKNGNSFYIAPEILKDQNYNYKCDIWSIGCIIYEMASLSLPFIGKNNEILFNNIMTGKIKPIPQFYSQNLKSIINDMLIIEPSKRPTIDKLLNYPNVKETIKRINIVYSNYKNNKILRNINKNQNNNLRTIDIFKKTNDYSTVNSISKNKIKKINNCTYRTLKQRKLIENLNENKHLRSRSNSNSNYINKKENITNSVFNYNFIFNKKLNNSVIRNNNDTLIPNSLSLFNDNLNFLLNDKFGNNLQYFYLKKNNSHNKNNNNKHILNNNETNKIININKCKLKQKKLLKVLDNINNNADNGLLSKSIYKPSKTMIENETNSENNKKLNTTIMRNIKEKFLNPLNQRNITIDNMNKLNNNKTSFYINEINKMNKNEELLYNKSFSKNKLLNSKTQNNCNLFFYQKIKSIPNMKKNNLKKQINNSIMKGEQNFIKNDIITNEPYISDIDKRNKRNNDYKLGLYKKYKNNEKQKINLILGKNNISYNISSPVNDKNLKMERLSNVNIKYKKNNENMIPVEQYAKSYIERIKNI